MRTALTAEGEELWNIVRDPHPAVILNASLNKHLSEDMAVFISKKRSTPAEVLGMLAADIRFKDSYKLKLAICKNPKTPQKITLSLLKFLRIFDLGDMTKEQLIPISIRQKIEYSISEKMASLPSGTKTALAKRSNSNIVVSLLEKGDKNVIAACLESPSITEGHLCKLINRLSSKPLLIRMIAENQKWSLRYDIRFALIRNFQTPMKYAVEFINSIKTSDLRELYSYGNLPTATKPFIYRELMDRNETVEPPKEELYELSEDEEADIDEIISNQDDS